MRLSCGECGERNHEIFADDPDRPRTVEIRCTKCTSVTVVSLPVRLHMKAAEDSPGGLAPMD